MSDQRDNVTYQIPRGKSLALEIETADHEIIKLTVKRSRQIGDEYLYLIAVDKPADMIVRKKPKP